MALLPRTSLMQVLRLLAALFLHARAEECKAPVAGIGSQIALRSPRSSLPALADIIGLEEAKAVLHEAVILPSTLAANTARLFWRSSDRTAILLVGPAGLGKGAAIEAAASAAGAQLLPLLASEAATSDFCRVATDAASASGRPVVVAIHGLETAPSAGLIVRQCLRDVADLEHDVAARIFIVATAARELQSIVAAPMLAPFGHVARLALPSDSERKVFIERLFVQISRVDALWGSALRETAVVTLANLTASYTFAEIDLVVRRAFLRSTNADGLRDPVALHHFEKILAETSPTAASAFTAAAGNPSPAAGVAVAIDVKKGSSDAGKPKEKKEVKDPMDGIFGWCNFWLPEALRLPAVVWAMILFGILAHFMARSTQPYGQRKRRSAGGSSGQGARSALFGDMGAAAGAPAAGGAAGFPSFGEGMSDWSSSFAGFPPPPGMAGRGAGDLPDSFLGGAGGVVAGDGPASASTKPQSFGPGGARGVAGDGAASVSASQATPSRSSTAPPE